MNTFEKAIQYVRDNCTFGQEEISCATVNAIKSEKVLAKHIYHHHWISGSSTVVYPITLWSRDVEIQVDTDRNLFKGCIKRIIEKFPNIFSNGYFCKSDGSCPSFVKLIYTDEAQRMLSAE